MHFVPKTKRAFIWDWKPPLICGLYVLSLLLSTYMVSLVLPKQAAPTRHATVLWDTWGVPHIFASNNKDLFYAFGYTQMQNHANLLLTLYGEARGRAAEYWGPNYLSSDEFVRTMGFPDRAGQWYEAQTSEFRQYISAFTTGMNDYAKEHPAQIAAQLKIVLPIQVRDVFAHGERVLADFLLGDCSPVLDSFNQGGRAAGSNGWAIGPAHSASGHTMLLANPHLPWSNEDTFFEAQLVSPSMSAYGATLVGFPVLVIAFNNYLSWTHTVNTIDTCDGYALTLSGNGYLFDGKVRFFDTRMQTLLVKQPNGTVKQQQLVIRRSVQGPIFAVGGNGSNAQMIAIRMVGVDQFPVYGVFQEWWDMGRAKNLNEFQAVLQRLQIPMFTVIYADRDGHVMSLFNGEVPKRPFGDWGYWSGVVPGDTSTTLWTTILAYRDLPKVIDPPSDWVQNSNSSPWFMTFPQVLNPQKYPPYIAPQNMSFREQRGVDMLTEQSRLSFEQMITDKFSTRMELADRILNTLIIDARMYGNNLAHRASDVLQAWNRTADAGSKGSALFYLWVIGMEQSNTPLFAVPWNPANPRTTPAGLANPRSAISTLEAAAQTLLSQTGSLDVPWGAVFHLNRGNVDLPASGGPGDPFGIFRALYFTSGAHGQFDAVAGDSYIAAVEFSTPLRAQVLLTYGNASQSGSPHNGDQLVLYAHNQMREAWLTMPKIEAHLASRDVL